MKHLALRLGLPLGFAALLGAGTLLAPERIQEPRFTVHSVAGSIAYLEGYGGNIGLFNGPDGFLLIDNQVKQVEEGMVAALAEHLGVDSTLATAAPLYLVNTHWHADHVGNNDVFGRSRVPILAHRNVRRRMSDDEQIGGRTQAFPKEALPTLTYTDEFALHLNGEEITVRHYPGAHTDGDSVVFFETSKVVHCGDVFFNGRFPFIDSGSGGGPVGYAAAIEAILEATDDSWKIIPGHGPLGTYADLEAAHAMLTTCTERVRKALAEGKTVEDMQKAELLGDLAEEYSWNFISAERFIADLVAGLSQ